MLANDASKNENDGNRKNYNRSTIKKQNVFSVCEAMLS